MENFMKLQNKLQDTLDAVTEINKEKSTRVFKKLVSLVCCLDKGLGTGGFERPMTAIFSSSFYTIKDCTDTKENFIKSVRAKISESKRKMMEQKRELKNSVLNFGRKMQFLVLHLFFSFFVVYLVYTNGSPNQKPVEDGIRGQLKMIGVEYTGNNISFDQITDLEAISHFVQAVSAKLALEMEDNEHFEFVEDQRDLWWEIFKEKPLYYFYYGYYSSSENSDESTLHYLSFSDWSLQKNSSGFSDDWLEETSSSLEHISLYSELEDIRAQMSPVGLVVSVDDLDSSKSGIWGLTQLDVSLECSMFCKVETNICFAQTFKELEVLDESDKATEVAGQNFILTRFPFRITFFKDQIEFFEVDLGSCSAVVPERHDTSSMDDPNQAPEQFRLDYIKLDEYFYQVKPKGDPETSNSLGGFSFHPKSGLSGLDEINYFFNQYAFDQDVTPALSPFHSLFFLLLDSFDYH